MKKSASGLVILPLSALLGSGLASAPPAAAARAATATTKSKAATTAPKSPAQTATTATTGKGVTRVEVNSDVDHYYVLFAKPVAGSNWEVPVAIAKGQATTTVLSDGRKQLPTTSYRVETFSNAKPDDVDTDGTDDLTELNGAPALNALSAVVKLKPSDGVAIVPDRATFEKLSYQATR